MFSILGTCSFPSVIHPPGLQTPIEDYAWPVGFAIATLFCVWKLFRGGN